MPASFEPLISERFYKRAEMWALVGYDAVAAVRVPQLPASEGDRPHQARHSPSKPRAPTSTRCRRSCAASIPPDYAPSTMTLVPLRDRADRRHPPGARRADGRGRLRAADRVRQRRQPAAGAHRAPRARPRAAGGARRQPRADRPAADGRERPARRRRRRCSASLVSVVAVPLLVQLAPATMSRLTSGADGRPRARVLDGAVARDGVPVRPAPGDQGVADRSAGLAARRGDAGRHTRRRRSRAGCSSAPTSRWRWCS